MYIAEVTVDYYTQKGVNKYLEFSETKKMWVKGFSLKDCANNIRNEKVQKAKYSHTISNINLLSLVTFAVRS